MQDDQERSYPPNPSKNKDQLLFTGVSDRFARELQKSVTSWREYAACFLVEAQPKASQHL